MLLLWGIHFSACRVGATDMVQLCRCASVRQRLEDFDVIELVTCLCFNEVICASNHLTSVVNSLELSQCLADLCLYCFLKAVQKGLLL